ncbi:MAG: hypothetical protein A2Z24_01620 [Candidatus Woykebacteria bacterium RBG_16_44_10]|uniref:RNA helicase n=1 Tax=Candidatus Woykebacteria bacterium RBG_16_44_10 TaxID=1802597 RepID=A0A1G1WFL5_9BACT|nr:MAG: hypothetical protein A2Z24_01620 [Candidatus Woykebacteria bacterium RBG_16_44_10]
MISDARRYSNGPKSDLGDDISIFIKKATGASDEATYIPQNRFATFAIVEPLKQNIANKGYRLPTPVQDKAILPILEGRDLIGLATTGTGKTAAFLIPLINKIYTDANQRVLIVTPTRELAGQINEDLHILSRGMGIYSSLAIGGADINRQISDIRRRPSVVIGTPGRLKDLIERRILHLDDFRTIVLDEVDMMVDIGFIRDIKYFISLLPRQRQSLFFSATIPPKVREILTAFVTDPVTVSVKKQDTAENIDQDVVKVVSHDQKLDQLHDLLNKEDFSKVLIFGRTKHGIEKLNRQLTDRGFRVGALHGNRSQGQRQRTLKSFKQDEISILLATDVASRGLDIDNVSHVINYDLPETYDDYIHRIGRTGRMNKKGTALTFVE